MLKVEAAQATKFYHLVFKQIKMLKPYHYNKDHIMAHLHEKGSEFGEAFNKIYLDDKWQKKIACIGIDF